MASAKKVSTSGHRLRTAPNSSGGDEYDDAAALAFLTAAVVDVVVGDGASVEAQSTTAPANSASSPNDGKCLCHRLFDVLRIVPYSSVFT